MSAFDSGDGRRWALEFDGGDRLQVWQWRWTIEKAFNGGGGDGVRWRRQRSMAFNGVGDGLRREDERAAQASQHDERTRGRCNERMARDDGGATTRIASS